MTENSYLQDSENMLKADAEDNEAEKVFQKINCYFEKSKVDKHDDELRIFFKSIDSESKLLFRTSTGYHPNLKIDSTIYSLMQKVEKKCEKNGFSMQVTIDGSGMSMWRVTRKL